VHDVVGHGLAAINMQATIALHILSSEHGAAGKPDQAAVALKAISRASAVSPSRRLRLSSAR
jgi:signal transduction histidine kinase